LVFLGVIAPSSSHTCFVSPNFTKDAEDLKEQCVEQLADSFNQWMADKIDDKTWAQIQTEFASLPPPDPSSKTLQPMPNPNTKMTHPIAPNVPPADDFSTLLFPILSVLRSGLVQFFDPKVGQPGLQLV
jgi:hypothetical protein